MPQQKHVSISLSPNENEPNGGAFLPGTSTTNNYIDVKFGHQMQMSSGYRHNPLVRKNTKMWKQIIREVQKKFKP